MQAVHQLSIKPVCTAPLWLVQQTPKEHSRASSMRAERDCLKYMWNEEQKCTLIILGGGIGCVWYRIASLLEWREWSGHLNAQCECLQDVGLFVSGSPAYTSEVLELFCADKQCEIWHWRAHTVPWTHEVQNGKAGICCRWCFLHLAPSSAFTHVAGSLNARQFQNLVLGSLWG